MKRYTYIFVALLILCQLSMSSQASDGVRSFVAATLSPSWRVLSYTKEGFFKLTALLPLGSFSSPEMKREMEMLRLENHTLRDQLELLKAQVDLEKLVGEEAGLLKSFAQDGGYAKRRKAEILRLIDLYMPSIIGKVIFRDSASWSSSFWINLGEKTNKLLGKTVIAKNSPVVLGTSVLGIVEYVGSQRSRVRLITDSSIAPSVRVLRGDEQKQTAARQAELLLEMLEASEETAPLKKELHQLCQKLNPKGENIYLAKGEMRGIREPLFRSRRASLHGVGFNYDIEDEEGSSRDLRSGKPVTTAGVEMPLVKKGDILVTTGMDGVFPAGLRVGQVSKVYPLRAGASSYELDALPLIGNFDEISFVTVLPPLDSEE